MPRQIILLLLLQQLKNTIFYFAEQNKNGNFANKKGTRIRGRFGSIGILIK